MRDFNGSNQYLTAPGITVGGADFSVAATIICDTRSVGRGVMGSSGSTAWFIQIGGDPTNGLAFYTAGDPSTFPTGVIRRVVGTYQHSGTVCTLYIDGTSVASANNAAITSASGIDIGRRGDGVYWDGGISEVGIWNAVLSLAEIRMYAAGYSPELIRPSSLMSEYHLLNNDGDRDTWGGQAITASNSPGYRATHPRAIYRRTAQLVAMAAAPIPPEASTQSSWTTVSGLCAGMGYD